MSLVIVSRPYPHTGAFGFRTAAVRRESVRLLQRADGGIGSASFELDHSVQIALEEEVKFEVDGQLVWRGFVTRRTRTNDGKNSSRRKVRYSCVDANRWLDRSIYHGSVSSITSDFDRTHLYLIFDNGGEGTRGVTTDTSFTRTLSATSYPNPPGITFEHAYFYGKTTRGAIEEMRDASQAWAGQDYQGQRANYYVDMADKFHWFWNEQDVRTLAWNFSDVPDGSTTFGYWDLEMTDDSNGFVNRFWRNEQAPPGAHYTANPDTISTYGRHEAIGPAGNIYELASTPYPVVSGGLRTRKAINAGDYVKVYNEGLGDATTKELLNADETAVMGLMRVPAVAITFPGEAEVQYDLTLVGKSPTLSSYIGR